MSYIKNITKVEVIETDELKSVIFPATNMCILCAQMAFRQIQAKSPSSCEITDKIESKVRIFNSKLTFKSCEQIDNDGAPLAYRLTTADGFRYLIGRDRQPFPVLTRTENMPSSLTETSLITYTVTWNDIVKPLQIIE